MKKLIAAVFIVFTTLFSGSAQDTCFVYRPIIPLVRESEANIIFDINIPNSQKGAALNSISIDLEPSITPALLGNLALYYTGTGSMVSTLSRSSGLEAAINDKGGAQKVYCNPSYAIKATEAKVDSNNMTLEVNHPLSIGDNHFYVSLTISSRLDLAASFGAEVVSAVVNGKALPLKIEGAQKSDKLRPAISLGDIPGAHSYRIPGIVTTPKGTLLGVYDVRRNNSIDLQEDIQVGLSRSTDGGNSWEPTKIIVDMRGTEALPDSQNGVGDPSILVDPKTGTIYVAALWTHGIAANRAWWGVRPGLEPEEGAAQLLIVSSTDDGKTWSKPQNITKQVRDSTWRISLQGPGRGITMEDGTLVFPFQYVDSAMMPHATMIYSKNRGQTWHLAETSAKSNTTEAQVVELNPGEIMINARDNRGGSRAIYTTKDMGKTWQEHPTSRSALIEPVCMASLIKVPASQNSTKKEILLFSNPNHLSQRKDITIKASTDGAKTWPAEHQVLLDNQKGWGYSCLTMIDKETVGILYESSAAQMTFQAIPLSAIIK